MSGALKSPVIIISQLSERDSIVSSVCVKYEPELAGGM